MRIIQGDITKVECDAVVNAANSELIAGGGVDGAIRACGGKRLEKALKQREYLLEGHTITTLSFEMPCKVIIHTVAPRYSEKIRESDYEYTLGWCYKSCCEEALKLGCQSIAFPLLGTGAYGWPMELGKIIAEEALKPFDEELDIILVEYKLVAPPPLAESLNL